MKKTFSVLLSLIILLSSLNFSLSAHYCGQTIVDVAIFGEAEACPMAAEMNCDTDEKPCCADRNIIIEGEDYLSSKSFENSHLSTNQRRQKTATVPSTLSIKQPDSSVSLNNQEIFQTSDQSIH